MLAFINTTVTKPEIIAQLEAHAAADEIVKGIYWENGRGCAVGCTIHSSNHAEYEPRFGIPQTLAYLKDRIFEGLPNGVRKAWPLRFMSAVMPGSDLSLVGWQFLHWLLITKDINPGIEHPLVRDAVIYCADVIADIASGGVVDIAKVEMWAAARAAETTEAPADVTTATEMMAAVWKAAAAAAAAEAAEAAEATEAAWAAAVAWAAARAAAEAAEATEAAARAAAVNTAEAAQAAAGAAAEKEVAWQKMADKLIELIEAAPIP